MDEQDFESTTSANSITPASTSYILSYFFLKCKAFLKKIAFDWKRKPDVRSLGSPEPIVLKSSGMKL